MASKWGGLTKCVMTQAKTIGVLSDLINEYTTFNCLILCYILYRCLLGPLKNYTQIGICMMVMAPQTLQKQTSKTVKLRILEYLCFKTSAVFEPILAIYVGYSSSHSEQLYVLPNCFPTTYLSSCIATAECPICCQRIFRGMCRHLFRFNQMYSSQRDN